LRAQVQLAAEVGDGRSRATEAVAALDHVPLPLRQARDRGCQHLGALQGQRLGLRIGRRRILDQPEHRPAVVGDRLVE